MKMGLVLFDKSQRAHETNEPTNVPDSNTSWRRQTQTRAMHNAVVCWKDLTSKDNSRISVKEGYTASLGTLGLHIVVLAVGPITCFTWEAERRHLSVVLLCQSAMLRWLVVPICAARRSHLLPSIIYNILWFSSWMLQQKQAHPTRCCLSNTVCCATQIMHMALPSRSARTNRWVHFTLFESFFLILRACHLEQSDVLLCNLTVSLHGFWQASKDNRFYRATLFVARS